tara:strand:+ start:70466 stop:70933 length:468 start_codon:yes stop_codon:yes gene_type:complete
MSKIKTILDSIDGSSNRSTARRVRVAVLKSMGITKSASDDQHGIFQHFQSGVLDYPTRDQYTSHRGGESTSRDNLYGVGIEQSDADNSYVEPARSLSTRYSPDRVGVQARRVGDGVYQDPYTNKVYDYNEGFTTEDGSVFPGGSPALQSSLDNLG